MTNGKSGEKPEYKVYRSRRGLLDSLRAKDPMARLRKDERRRPEVPPGLEPPRRRRPPVRRILRWVAIALGAWLTLSLVLFFVSAQLEEGVSAETDRALSGGSSLVTGSTVLVLGSDERPARSREGGEGTGRADSILLLHAGFGSVRRLSILRDSLAEIPGHGTGKINAAYAFGGPALTIETVERFLGNGLEINHLVEVNFNDFPELIDALGGVDITLKRCVASGFEGRTFRLRKGEHHLDGEQALAFARVRKNRCSPNQDDRARAKRQQQVLSAIRSRVLSPATFFRLPWVSWQAPKALRTDMAGPGLFGLFTDLLTGGAGRTRVLRPSGSDGSNLIVSEAEKERAVDGLLGN